MFCGCNSRYSSSSSRGKEKETNKMLTLKVVGIHCSGQFEIAFFSFTFQVSKHVSQVAWMINKNDDEN